MSGNNSISSITNSTIQAFMTTAQTDLQAGNLADACANIVQAFNLAREPLRVRLTRPANATTWSAETKSLFGYIQRTNRRLSIIAVGINLVQYLHYDRVMPRVRPATANTAMEVVFPHGLIPDAETTQTQFDFALAAILQMQAYVAAAG